jgi:preprotein translocase subunit SecF
MVATFFAIFVNSLNFGIDFTGGILFEVRLPKEPNLENLRQTLNNLEIGDINLQSLDHSNDLMIRLGVKDESQRELYIENIKSLLNKEFSNEVEFRKVEFVGAEVGGEMIQKGIISVTLTMVGIILYVWYRFNWQYSIGIIAGLLHDLILTVGFLAITRFEFNTTSIAAILAVLGYSVNDTVVIYDRVRENVRKIRKQPMDSILNISTNETLSRTLLTVITTLIAVAALIVYGGEALHSFSITVFVGIVVGTYSSIFISVPILGILQDKKS